MKITLKDYLTASGAYPEREKHKELTKELLANANKLVDTVNAFLEELGAKGPFKVSSGYRPSDVNAKIANAAKRSLHQQCLAIDLLDDKKQSLANLVLTRPDLLIKYKLWIEDPASTKGKQTNWLHADLGTRSDRPLRMFKP